MAIIGVRVMKIGTTNSLWWHNRMKCILFARIGWSNKNWSIREFIGTEKYVSTILDFIRSKMVRSNMNSRIAAAATATMATAYSLHTHSLSHFNTPYTWQWASERCCQFRSYVKRLSSSHQLKNNSWPRPHQKKSSLSLNRRRRHRRVSDTLDVVW